MRGSAVLPILALAAGIVPAAGGEDSLRVGCNLPVANVGLPFTGELIPRGGTGPYEWVVTPVHHEKQAAPPDTGLDCQWCTKPKKPECVIECVPALAGMFSLKISVKDSTRSEADTVCWLKVYPGRPRILSTEPQRWSARGRGFWMEISGRNFTSSSQVEWRHQEENEEDDWDKLETRYEQDSGSLTAFVPGNEAGEGSLLATPGTVSIRVRNREDPPGIPEEPPWNEFGFVVDLAPKITALVPACLTAGAPGFNLMVKDGVFHESSQVEWLGPKSEEWVKLDILSVSDTQLIAAVPASLVTEPGTANVRVRKVDHDALSNVAPFTIYPRLEVDCEKLVDAFSGEPYRAELQARGGTGQYRWRQSDGELPPGLVLAENGFISGVPTTELETLRVELLDGPVLEPLSQPRVRVTLTEPTRVDRSGKLNLIFRPNVVGDDNSDDFCPDDEHIQFLASGEPDEGTCREKPPEERPVRSVRFLIPEGETIALFPGEPGADAPSAGFQAGTTAGEISFTATVKHQRSFNFEVEVQSGCESLASAECALDLKEQGTHNAAATMDRLPPVIRAGKLESRAAQQEDVVIQGFSTPREIQRVKVVFTAAEGFELEADAAGAADLPSRFQEWYSTPGSQKTGTQFDLRINLALSGDRAAVRTVSVTLHNTVGSSNICEIDFDTRQPVDPTLCHPLR